MVKIICTTKMADFILQNLTQISSAKVSCELDNLGTIAPREERCKEITSTVASYVLILSQLLDLELLAVKCLL